MSIERPHDHLQQNQGVREISLDMLLFGDGKDTKRGLLYTFYGNPLGDELKKRARSGETIPQQLKKDVDTLFFQRLKEVFALPGESDPQEFYRSSLKSANFAVSSFINNFPSESSRIDLRNEVIAFDDSPHDNFYLFCAPDNKVAPKLQFEVGRQLGLGYIAGAIEARSRKNGLQRKLAQMQRLFAEKLYDGPIGSGVSTDTYAWHDNNTNAATKLCADSDPDEQPYVNTHLKKHTQEVRQVPDIGSVYSDLQEKEPSSAILKILRKAVEDKEKGGTGKVNIDEAVRDMVRGKMVVLGTKDINDPKISKLIQRVRNTIEENSGTVEDPERGSLGELEYIKEKNATRGSNGQSEKVSFKRLLIKYKELPVPIELKFASQQDELNDEFEIGTKGDEGHYDGRAHALYEVRRLEGITNILFPPEIY